MNVFELRDKIVGDYEIFTRSFACIRPQDIREFLDELRYILDPADIEDEDYPSETFRVLKEKEIQEFGEYLTRCLALEAWDRLAEGGA